MQRKRVYIIAGPAGVGKSTTAKQLAKYFENSAYISGDVVSHMHVNGRKKPWESKEETLLIWNNILQLTKNFLLTGNDVIIDYISFPNDVQWLANHLHPTEIIYVVLMADEKILRQRDQQRSQAHQMGDRVAILRNEFLQFKLTAKHSLDTSEKDINHLPEILEEIIYQPKYIFMNDQ